MNESNITKLFFSDLEKLFQKIKENGADLDFVYKIELGKKFTKSMLLHLSMRRLQVRTLQTPHLF